MDAITSPTKRRALASLDANALPSPRLVKQQDGPLKTSLTPFKDRETDAGLSRKRGPDAAAGGASPSPEKKTCREDYARSRSQSPDCSSVFDISTNDSSWANTTATEPDTSPAPRTMTREQAREKAEILRLRLGLASYKFRTGQTTIPLANLQHKPLPQRAPRIAQEEDSRKQQERESSSREDDQDDEDTTIGSQETSTADNNSNDEDNKDEDEDDTPITARPVSPGKVAGTPQRRRVLEEDERLMSSGLRGGAVTGLLSLARGGSGS